jgi:hypothetical protein
MLPKPAAADVQSYWQVAAGHQQHMGPASGLKPGRPAESNVWAMTVLPLTVDFAYILTAARQAAAAKASAAVAAVDVAVGWNVEVQQVLQQLLMHLARCRMLAFLKCLVQTLSDLLGLQAAGDSGAAHLEGNHEPGVCSSRSGLESSHNVSKVINKGKPCRQVTTGNASDSGRSAAVDNAHSVTIPELWWGFKDPTMEASYQAASFSATGMLDCVCVVYSIVLGLSCYSARQGHNNSSSISSSDGHHVSTLGMPAAASSGVLLLSKVLALFAVAGGPVGVLILRLHVVTLLQVVKQQQQQQRHRAQRHAPSCHPVSSADLSCTKYHSEQGVGDMDGTCSMMYSGKALLVNTDSSYTWQQQSQTQQADDVLAKASSTKQLLQMVWVVCILAWASLLLCGPGFIAPPMPLLHIWGSNSWSAHLAVVLSVALRSCFSQLPLALYCPAVVVELLANVIGSYRLGLRSLQWLVVRFVGGVAVPLIIAAVLQQQGRGCFCASRRISVI